MWLHTIGWLVLKKTCSANFDMSIVYELCTVAFVSKQCDFCPKGLLEEEPCTEIFL